MVRFFPVWLGFSVLAHFFLVLARVFPVLARFFRFGSVFFRFDSVFSGYFFGSVWFFRFYKPKTDTEPVGFFKILMGLIGFFFRLSFLDYFFLGFLGFSVFLLTPNVNTVRVRGYDVVKWENG